MGGKILSKLNGIKPLEINKENDQKDIRYSIINGTKPPDNWLIKNFDDVVTIVGGQVDPREEPYSSMPHIGPGNVEAMTGKLLEYRTAKEDGQISGKYLFNEKHILYGKINPQLGKVAMPGFRGICSADMYAFEANEDYLMPEYLKYLLFNTSFYRYTVSVSKRTGMPKVNREDLSGVKFLLPSIIEQKRIAGILSTWDKAIELKEKLIEEKKKQKSGLMQKLLTRKVRLPGFDGEWALITLGDYLIKHTEKTTENNQYPVLTSSRNGIFFQKDYFDGNDVASKDNTGYNVVPRDFFTYRHMSDDLIFKFNINTIVDKGIVSTLYPVFTTKKELDSNYLKLVLNEGIEFKQHALSQKQGGSRTYMYYSKLEELEIKIPSIEEQVAISELEKLANREIELLEKELEALKQQKKGLMQLLLTGIVRVNGVTN